MVAVLPNIAASNASVQRSLQGVLCLQELYNKLYMHLATDMHMALNQLVSNRPSVAKAATAKGSSKGPEGPTRHQLAVLKGLADEAELTGDQAAAERYHQERTLAPANPQVTSLLIPSTHSSLLLLT